MTATNRHFYAKKEREYKLYLIWRSLPRDLPVAITDKIFVSDEIVLALSQCKTQKELATYLHVRPKTISDWNKEPIPDEFKELDWRYWARLATPKVVAALLREMLKKGDAHRFTAWMKYVEEFEEKSRHALTDADGNDFIGGLADLIAGADKVLEQHGEIVE